MRHRRSKGALVAAVAAALLLVRPATAAEDSPGTRRVTLPDGAIVALTMAGSGPPLVFIHGWACNREHWREQLPVFAADHTVVALDLPGHGESTGERAAWTLEQYGADVAAVVGELGLERVVLVGHSMGGPVALEAARRLGPRVAGIVAVDTLHDADSEIGPEMRAQLDQLLAAYRVNFAGVCAVVAPQMLLPDIDPALAQWISEGMCRTRPEVAVALFERFPAFDYAAAMKAVAAPIRGINAQQVPTRVEVNRKYSPGFDAIIIEGPGHFLQLEAPDRFNQALRQTLATIAAAGAAR